ncbi:uncharacterized protein [Clytia hemisphaerica]|uniref:uncharacterized protein n=1 Tax=Clytia hemisphaerica TaxID=252671 RepID=UPI0034D61466
MSTRDLLAKHETVATFNGLEDRPCFFRTSRCPNECGHAATLAVFHVIKYLNYEKPGKYGDKKQEKFHVRPSDSVEISGLTPDRKSVLESLKGGDYVLLSWNHDYVHTGGCSSPQRPITKLDKISKEEADEM